MKEFMQASVPLRIPAVLPIVCLAVFVTQHPRHYGFTHGHIADDSQRNCLIGLSPTAGYSGIRVRKYHYPRHLSLLSYGCNP